MKSLRVYGVVFVDNIEVVKLMFMRKGVRILYISYMGLGIVWVFICLFVGIWNYYILNIVMWFLKYRVFVFWSIWYEIGV